MKVREGNTRRLDPQDALEKRHEDVGDRKVPADVPESRRVDGLQHVTPDRGAGRGEQIGAHR